MAVSQVACQRAESRLCFRVVHARIGSVLQSGGQARDSRGSLVYVRVMLCTIDIVGSGLGLCAARRVLKMRDSGGACLEASVAKRLCLADTLGTGILSRGDVRLQVIYECSEQREEKKKLLARRNEVEESGVVRWVYRWRR